MRKFVSSVGIILLALLVSGWGNALAAALCPHAGMNRPLKMEEDRPCHSTKLQTAAAHEQHQGTQHEAAPNHQMNPVAALELQGGQAALGQSRQSCAHCISHRQFPAAPASVRELTLQKRDAGKSVVNKIILTALPLAVSVSRFVPSQHAPPGFAARKHLLLGVFLI